MRRSVLHGVNALGARAARRDCGVGCGPRFFCRESSSDGPASDAPDDREEPPKPVGQGIVLSTVDFAVLVLLRGAERNGVDPRPDAVDRQRVAGDLLQPSAAPRRPWRSTRLPWSTSTVSQPISGRRQ